MSDIFYTPFRKDLLAGSYPCGLHSSQPSCINAELAIEFDIVVVELAAAGPDELLRFSILAQHARTVYESVAYHWCYYQAPLGDFTFFHDVAAEVSSEAGATVFLAKANLESLSFSQYVVAVARWLVGCPFEELERGDSLFPAMYEWAQKKLYQAPPIPAKASPNAAGIKKHLRSILLSPPLANHVSPEIPLVELPTFPNQPSAAQTGSVVPEIQQSNPWLFESIVGPKLVEYIMNNHDRTKASPFMQWLSKRQEPVFMLHEQARMLGLVGNKCARRYNGNLVFVRCDLNSPDDYQEPLKNVSTNWVQAHSLLALGCFRGWILEHNSATFYKIDIGLSHEMSLTQISVYEDWNSGSRTGVIDLCVDEYKLFKARFSSTIRLASTDSRKMMRGKKYKQRYAGTEDIHIPHPNVFLQMAQLKILKDCLAHARETARVELALSLNWRFLAASSPSHQALGGITNMPAVPRTSQTLYRGPYSNLPNLPNRPLLDDGMVGCRLLLDEDD